MSSKPEQEFEALWERTFPDVDLIKEVRLIKGRRWRWDWVHEPSRTALELDGGGWLHGRHHRPQGRINDNEKDLAALEAGYVTIRFVPEMVDTELLHQIHRVMEQREQMFKFLAGCLVGS